METPYILSDAPRGTLYTGVTSDLRTRIFQHKTKHFPGFSAKYELTMLVWYEAHDSMEVAIQREKSLKRWRREWKLALIEKRDSPIFQYTARSSLPKAQRILRTSSRRGSVCSTLYELKPGSKL